jgi:hypothetical protein
VHRLRKERTKRYETFTVDRAYASRITYSLLSLPTSITRQTKILDPDLMQVSPSIVDVRRKEPTLEKFVKDLAGIDTAAGLFPIVHLEHTY